MVEPPDRSPEYRQAVMLVVRAEPAGGDRIIPEHLVGDRKPHDVGVEPDQRLRLVAPYDQMLESGARRGTGHGVALYGPALPEEQGIPVGISHGEGAGLEEGGWRRVERCTAPLEPRPQRRHRR